MRNILKIGGLLMLLFALTGCFWLGVTVLDGFRKLLGYEEFGQVGFAVQQTSDGGYIVAGRTVGYDGVVLKLNNAGDLEWRRTFDGSGMDFLSSVQQTTDGGFVAAGNVGSGVLGIDHRPGLIDLHVVKLDGDGNTEWQKLYGGSDYEGGGWIWETSDGGFVLAGWSESTDILGLENREGCYVVKLDADGTIEWQQMYVHGGSGEGHVHSIQQTADGGFVVVGLSESTDIAGVENNGERDCYVAKFDADGNTEWQGLFGGSGRDEGLSAQQTADGGFVLAGWSESTDIPEAENSGERDCYVVRLDGDGSIQWQGMYGGSGSDEGASAQQTADGGFAVTGWSDSTDFSGVENTPTGPYIMKLDGDGSVEWRQVYGDGTIEWQHYYNGGGIHSIQQTNDGGFVVVGAMIDDSQFDVYEYVYVLKTDSAGNVEWEHFHGGTEYPAPR